jgi:hypothetical protein
VRWRLGRKKVRGSEELEEARRERRISEQRMRDTHPIAVSLHEMRRENHIKPLIKALVMRDKEG